MAGRGVLALLVTMLSLHGMVDATMPCLSSSSTGGPCAALTTLDFHALSADYPYGGIVESCVASKTFTSYADPAYTAFANECSHNLGCTIQKSASVVAATCSCPFPQPCRTATSTQAEQAVAATNVNGQQALQACKNMQPGSQQQQQCYGCVAHACFSPDYCDYGALQACATCSTQFCFQCVWAAKFAGWFDEYAVRACESCGSLACATCVQYARFSDHFDTSAVDKCVTCGGDCTDCVAAARHTAAGYYDHAALSEC